ncbi:HET protein, partial [Coniophora puteana RWD-64-598 SS2]
MGEDHAGTVPVCSDPNGTPSNKRLSLCYVCSSLDFHKIFREGVSEGYHNLFVEDGFVNRDPIPFDSLISVLSRSSICAFCSLVSTTIRRIWLLDTACANVDISDINLSLHTVGVRLNREGETGLERALRISIKPSRRPSEVERVNGGAQNDLSLHIQLMEEHAEQFGRLHDWHGRTVGEELNIERIKRWLHSCEQGHGEQCGPAPWAVNDGLPNRMHVLDVQDMALVSALPGCRYLALSYVWGNAAQCDYRSYCTLASNLSDRMKPGGVPLAALPVTISDTVLLVRALGERYLWVDALCICQDDPVHKISQIVAMDRIYMRATLTIYAAGGSSVLAPLPGFRPGTRSPQQHIEEVQGLRLGVPLPASREALASTSWVGRGWTYQELLLSTRRLILTPSQAIFECCTD